MEKALFGVGVIAVLLAINLWAPPYTLSPICAPGQLWRASQQISINGRIYSASSVHQASHSRKWVQEVNANGCVQSRGKAVVFRLTDDRILLSNPNMCPRASELLYETGTVNIKQQCFGPSQVNSFDAPGAKWRPYDGILVNDANHPSKYEHVWFDVPTLSGEIFHLISSTAKSGPLRPSDDLDRVAPKILQTTFGGDDGLYTPEPSGGARFHASPVHGKEEPVYIGQR